jgi:hypothetical protein
MGASGYCFDFSLNVTELTATLKKNGAPRKIRTSDRSVRSRVLYPAELWVHRITSFTADLMLFVVLNNIKLDGASGELLTVHAQTGRC